MTSERIPTRRRWLLSPIAVRAVLSGHSVLGLAFAAIIYLVCLTGSIAVFQPDLERWEVPTAPAVTHLSDTAIARAVRGAAERAPDGTSLYLQLPTPERLGASVTAYKTDFEKEWAIGERGTLTPLEASWTEFLLHLHINLHLPRSWGEFLVGMTGVALLSSLISGLLAHPRIFRDAFHLRLGGARRLQEADLHNRLGVWAFPFHFVIALTGALLGLSAIIVGVLALLLYRGDTAQVYGLFSDPVPAVDARPAPMPDIARMLAEARKRAPGAELANLSVERAGRADMRISVESRRPRNLVPQDETTFDVSGQVVGDDHPPEILGLKLLGGVGQLHFGWFGGWPVRLLYGALGLALCAVTASGVNIWLARRRDRARPAPIWEKLWTVTIWGQPAILALTALLALVGPETIGVILPALWLGATMVLYLAAALFTRIDRTLMERTLRYTTAVLLLALAAVHLVSHAAAVHGLPVDIALLALGSGLAYLSFRRRSTDRPADMVKSAPAA